MEVVSLPKFEDLTGQKFGMLTVLGYEGRKERKGGWYYLWKVKCDCGRELIRQRGSIKNKVNKVVNCGCATKELAIESRKKHLMTNTRFYKIYTAMKKRVLNKNEDAYKDYGGRGIKLDDLWKKDFLEFKKDMYDEYLEHVKKHGERNTTLERKDVNGNYSKDNCTWATYQEQASNTRRNKPFIAENIKTGERHYGKNVNEFCRSIGKTNKHVYRVFNKPDKQLYGYRFKHISEEEYQKHLVQISI